LGDGNTYGGSIRIEENICAMGTVMAVYMIWRRHRRAVAEWHIVGVGLTRKFISGLLQ
jgi:hypothetical protein